MVVSNLDAVGLSHERAGPNPRIVSLVPSITELLFDLGLADSVVGRTGFCIHPKKEVKSVPKVGGTKDVKIKQLLSLQPTHVIVNIDENTRDTYETLRKVVKNVIVTHPIQSTDNLDLYKLIGWIFNRDKEANAFCMLLEQRLEKLAQSTLNRERQTVIYLIWREPWMTISTNTYIGQMLELANWGLIETHSSKRYPEINEQLLRSKDADLVLLSSEPYPFKEKHCKEIADLRGNKTGIHIVDGEMFSWYGSRALKAINYIERFSSNLARN